MPWAREPSLEKSLAMTDRDERAWEAGVHLNFVLVDKQTMQALGVVGLNRESPDAVELHYWIRTDHAGRGLTTEACSALIQWASSELGLQRVTLWAGRENHASRRVAEKLGFQHIGPLAWRPEGGLGYFDAESYELALAR